MNHSWAEVASTAPYIVQPGLASQRQAARSARASQGMRWPPPAFDLDPPVRHVIHTVGPVWEGGDYGEPAILASCYRRSLRVADELGARSIAFPAIATGAYGFPSQEAARIAMATIKSTPTDVELIRLVAFDDETQTHLQAALAGQP